MKGTLYLVATPIGNLKDITLRAIEILKEADLIAAEDTRQTLKLLNHYEIKKPLISYHEHNKRELGGKIIEKINEGIKVALVTDAGTPAISDPGEDIVREAIEEGIDVYSIPGPSAFVYALTVSGLPTGKFVFEGFLPREGKERKERLSKLINEDRTIIFYEAPHRLLKTLKDILSSFGDRRCAVCRELTKLHEEVLRLSLSEAVEYFTSKEPKGEFVIVLKGKSSEEIEREKEEEFSNISIEDHIKMYMENGMSKKDAVKAVSKERNIPKTEVYRHSIGI